MIRKILVGVLFAGLSFVVPATLSAAVDSATYYWADPASSAKFGDTSKWKMEDGTTATGYPGTWPNTKSDSGDYPNATWAAWQENGYKGDTAVFTNATALSLAMQNSSKATVRGYALNYLFKGTNVSLTTTALWGFFHGGRMTVDGPATIENVGNTTFKDEMAPADGGTFTFDVKNKNGLIRLATGSTSSDNRYLLLEPKNTFVKTGTGTFACAHEFRWNGTVDFREGALDFSPDKVQALTGACLKVTGPATKKLYAMGSGNLYLKFYEESEDALGTLTIYRDADKARDFRIIASEDVPRFSAKVDKSKGGYNVKLWWSPTVAGKTLNVVGTTYDNNGIYFYATNGVMRFCKGAGVGPKGFAGLRVWSGGTVAIAEDAGKFASWSASKKFVIYNGGFLKIEGRSNVLTLPSGLLTSGGTGDANIVPDGLYHAGDFPWLIGEGWLRIGAEPTATAAAWTGNGGTDTSVLNPANWGAADNQVLPDLENGSLVATFFAGTKATIPAGKTVRFRGIDVSGAPQGYFVFEKGGEGAEWTLGSDGVVANDTAFTNACPLFVMADQTWAVNARVTMTGTAVVRGPKNVTITVSGSGAFDVSSSNLDFCNLTTDGSVYPRADWALGGPLSTVTIDNGGKLVGDSACRVYLYGNSFSNKFVSAIQCSGLTKNSFLYLSSGVNELYGPVTVTGKKYALMSCSANSGDAVVNFHGGLAYAETGSYAMTGGPRVYGSTYAFYDVPFNVTKYFYGYNGNPGTLELNVASNVTTRGIIMDGHDENAEEFTKGKFLTKVPYALYATDDGQSGFGFVGGGTWDLCGCDQGVNVLWGGLFHTNCSAIVKSTAAATLHLRDDRLNTAGGESGNTSLTTRKVQVDRARYQGAVSLSKEGALDRWMINDSTSTGELAVSAGKLIFASGKEGSQTLAADGVSGSAYTFTPTRGSWAGKTITLSGTGVLETHYAKALAKDVALTIAGDETARLVVPAGVELRCASLTLNGRSVTGVAPDGLVTGGGTLFAGKRGLLLIAR